MRGATIMTMTDIVIEGLDGSPIRCVRSLPGNTGGTSDAAPDDLAVILPGYAYPCDAPLLFFLRLLLVESGWEVMAVDYRYNERARFLALPDAGKDEFIREEQRFLAARILGSGTSRNRFLFAGKSLGTTALTIWRDTPELRVVEKRSGFIWLTPAQALPDIVGIIAGGGTPSLLIAGGSDPHFKRELLEPILGQQGEGCRFLIVPEAGHILESEEGIAKSIQNTASAIGFIREKLETGFPV